MVQFHSLLGNNNATLNNVEKFNNNGTTERKIMSNVHSSLLILYFLAKNLLILAFPLFRTPSTHVEGVVLESRGDNILIPIRGQSVFFLPNTKNTLSKTRDTAKSWV